MATEEPAASGRSSRISAIAPITAPTSDGNGSSGSASGRVAAATAPTSAEHGDTGEADRSPAYGEGTGDERQQQQQHEDRADQDVLVVGAELG